MTDSIERGTSYLASTDDGYVQAKVGLIRKRAAIVGELEALNLQVTQKTADLRAIEAALRVLEPELTSMDGLPVRKAPTPFVAFRGEIGRFILTELRNAPDGLTTKELGLGFMRERHMDTTDISAAKLMQRRVGHSLHNLHKQAMVRSAAADRSGLLRWWLA